MPSIPPTMSLIAPDADEALTSLLDRHLRSQGVELDERQLRLIKQQRPVLQFLHAIVDLGRRQLQEDARSADQVVLDAVPSAGVVSTDPAAPPSVSAQTEFPSPLISPSTSFLSQATGEIKRYTPEDFSVQACTLPAMTAPLAAAEAPSPTSEQPVQLPLSEISKSTPVPANPPSPVTPSTLNPPVGDAAHTPAVPPTALKLTPPPAPKPVRLPKLRLPNGTADTQYVHSIDLAKVSELANYRLVEMTGLDGSGLSFDPTTPRIHGTPVVEAGKPHEFTFLAKLVQWSDESKTVITEVNLFINPHPRSLWKEIDPDPSLEFQKAHRRSQDFHSSGLRAVLASVRGRSHANSGTFREDDFHVRSDSTGNWTVVAVSDGAGSAKYSRRGSQIATEQSVELLAAALPAFDAQLETLFPPDIAANLNENASALDEVRRALLEPVGRAVFNASKAIVAEAAKLKVEEKLLSATLLLAAVRPYANGLLVAAYWVGDGAAAIFDPETGTLHLLGDADAGEYSGQTRFLLSSEFSSNVWDSITKRFRCRWVPAGSSVVLMTDGVSDPKFGTDNSLRDPGRWLSWWRDDLTAAVNLSRENVALPKDLEGYLGFWSQGEHDDRTLALVY